MISGIIGEGVEKRTCIYVLLGFKAFFFPFLF